MSQSFDEMETRQSRKPVRDGSSLVAFRHLFLQQGDTQIET